MEGFASERRIQKQTIRQCQLDSFKSSSSRFITHFCSVLSETKDTKEISLFLVCMKIILNSCSIEILPNLRNSFVDAKNRLRHLHSDDDSYGVCQTEVQALVDELYNSSLGLENIFREIGQAFESIVESIGSETIQTKFVLTLPKLIARLVVDGMPLELLDGDTAFPLMTWITAVFDEIQNIIGERTRIYVISVLGIQSSGKSTLLNTMFGLQFSVSAGRCTRGVFCQLIPVEAEYARKLSYDYILVVDTEGLRAPELIDTDKTHDNELATFVVGLANLTIVNIKGENFSEMQNVLEIVVHAMLRIKFVTSAMEQLNPSCVFIHHNVGTANAHDRLRVGETNLLTVLDRVTKSAAEQEKKPNIRSFKDIINYDEETLSLYLPDLWQGDPPMAPVNYGYSERVFKIKELIINKITRTSVPMTVNQFTNRMKKLWESILYEDFIFSFRNGEEVKAYLQLDEFCSQLLWNLKRNTMSLQEQFTTKINECSNDVHSLIRELETQLEGNISNINQQLQIELKNYLENSVNKYVIEQWRNRYIKNLENMCADVKNKIMETMYRHSKLKNQRDHDKRRFEEFIMNGVEQMVRELKINHSEVSEENLSSRFDEKWQHWITSFFPWSSIKEAKKIVYEAIDTELRYMFNQHHYLLLAELEIRRSWNLDDCNFEKYPDALLECDRIILDTLKKKGKDHEGRCLRFIHTSCNNIFQKVEQSVKELVGSDFQTGHATQVMQMIKDFFIDVEKDGKQLDFTFPIQLRIRVAMYITSCAANEFIKLRNKFMERTTPSADVLNYKSIALDKLRSEYYGSTLRSYDQLKKGTKAVANVVCYWIEYTVEQELGCVIADRIVTNSNGAFNNKLSFLKKVLIDLGKIQNIEEYLKFLQNRESFLKEKIIRLAKNVILSRQSSNSNNKTQLQIVVESEIDKYTNHAIEYIEQLETDMFVDVEKYLRMLKWMLQQRMLSPPYTEDYVRNLPISNMKRFTDTLIITIRKAVSKISEKLNNNIYENIQTFPIKNNTIDLLSEKVLGCLRTCPFCSAQCSLSRSNHSDDHIAFEHYPVGLHGSHSADKKVHFHNCQVAVSSQDSYVYCYDPVAKGRYRDFKTYYPNWEIGPDRSTKMSPYWKWFIVQFQNDLKNHYKIDQSSIPPSWKKIKWQEAANCLPDKYQLE